MFPKPELSCTCKPTKATMATSTFGTKVLVVTGHLDALDTEIIDLENSKFACSKVGKFPKTLFHANGGLVGKTPMVCGGWSSGTFKKSCYNLEENGVWKEDEKAKLVRGKHNQISGSVVIKNQLFIPEYVGLNGSSKMGYLYFEMVEPGKEPITLQPFTAPFNRYGIFTGIKMSCIVKWDDNTIMLIGANFGRETLFINMKFKSVRKGPNLIEETMNPACHEMIINGEPHIIVTGGESAKSTQILYKFSFWKGWQKGKKLNIT